ncbi:hypothetical protein LC653_36495 [Nostoc sp. CHAB 5784]|uniref:hypothetical protein n=1 Tax=Nostoc mirabile TaxID=2907820 RepID=UPI001E4CA111|nr:hypothetical protein [Nostoc mirabile]MCC5669198.1 hypothetical protein [Nostoc mirabile CHAB5784]
MLLSHLYLHSPFSPEVSHSWVVVAAIAGGTLGEKRSPEGVRLLCYYQPRLREHDDSVKGDHCNSGIKWSV